uniref:Acyl-CoA dehydrogenase n=1 Tax=Panagrellus redivivus TaxID=6233 RepID=A0A7E4VMH3_PANRE
MHLLKSSIHRFNTFLVAKSKLLPPTSHSTRSSHNYAESFYATDDNEYDLFIETARKFVLDEVVPKAGHYDETGEYPWELVRKAHELGLMNTDTPEEYGGLELPLPTKARLYEEFGYGCTGLGTSLMVNELAQIPLRLAGSTYLRDKYIRKMTESPILASYAVTEANAGSDLANLKTRAELRMGHFVLNGSKVWITNGGIADWFFVLARTDFQMNAPRSTAFSGFIVDASTAGITVGKKEQNMGQRCSDTRTIHFDNVIVPLENVVGEPGDGFKLAMRSFDRTRPIVAAMACGLSRRALDAATTYATQRKTFGRPLTDHQGISFKLANMAMNLELSRLAMTKAATIVEENGKDAAYFSSIAKCFAADTAVRAASDAIQVFGGNGFNKEYPVEKLLRDAKLLQIYGGTSEIQKLVVSRRLVARYV